MNSGRLAFQTVDGGTVGLIARRTLSSRFQADIDGREPEVLHSLDVWRPLIAGLLQ
jgi:hypothetical protein